MIRDIAIAEFDTQVRVLALLRVFEIWCRENPWADPNNVYLEAVDNELTFYWEGERETINERNRETHS